jgi:uncharacterized protein YciI
MRCPQRTLVLSEFAENAANSARFVEEHLDYMRGLMNSGKVISAGPMTDSHTAAIVFATKDWTEAEERLKKEPFHREHVLKVTEHGQTYLEASRRRGSGKSFFADGERAAQVGLALLCPPLREQNGKHIGKRGWQRTTPRLKVIPVRRKQLDQARHVHLFQNVRAGEAFQIRSLGHNLDPLGNSWDSMGNQNE